ncbi:MAG: hypothetical protein ACR2GD_11340, partial [Pyrinomonadaceae bacterium]
MNGEEKTNVVFVAASSAIVRAGWKVVWKKAADLVVSGGAAEIPSAPPAFPDGFSFDVLLAVVETENEFVALSEFLGGDEKSL